MFDACTDYVMNLFHNGGLLVYSFICMIISLYDLIQKFVNNSWAQQPITSAKIRHVLVFWTPVKHCQTKKPGGGSWFQSQGKAELIISCCIDIVYFRACLHGGGGPQVGEVKYGGSHHLSCKRDQIKMRVYMDKRVTPPKQVTSPT